MEFGTLASFLEFWFTSYPFPVSLLILIIAVAVFWFVKIKPEKDAKDREREEARVNAERERAEEFVKVMTHCEETSKSTIAMYEKALDNSTKAIENNTAALNMMSLNLKNLTETSKAHDHSIDKIREGQNKLHEGVLKTLTILENMDKD